MDWRGWNTGCEEVDGKSYAVEVDTQIYRYTKRCIVFQEFSDAHAFTF